MTYDLRRLRHHGLITRILGSHRYRVIDTGLADALLLTRAQDRLLRTGLAEITDPTSPSPLRAASTRYRAASTTSHNEPGSQPDPPATNIGSIMTAVAAQAI